MRIRVTFSKTDAMRYTGHLDLHRTWERTCRRAGLPLAYSQGFHPQPRISLACALPLGFTSQCELIDIWLEEDLPVDSIHRMFKISVPPGIHITSIEEIDARAPALQTLVQSSEYIVTLLDNIHYLDERISELISAETLPRQRHDKSYDLRPLILELERLPKDAQGHARMRMLLSAQAGATGRPEEVLAVLGIPFESTRVHRVKLIF